MLLEACIVSIVMPEPRTFSNRVLVLLKKTQNKTSPKLTIMEGMCLNFDVSHICCWL